MSAMKIKKGDTVRIIAGKDKGKEGKILAVNVKDSTVIVENANMVTKHTKPSAANQNGGIVTKESPLHISNVMLLVDGNPYRVGFQIKDGKKVRVAKKAGEIVKTID
ncbi:MAG: 50S ribosomal protein L24 [Clostridiales bacterium]|nr:50S ribosomal protein L24 [Clostridiales bacterium]